MAASDSPSGRGAGNNQIWSEVLHRAVRHVYPRWHPLLLEGKAICDFYYLEQGRLRITYASKNGRERSMLVVERGSLFNEASALVGYDNPDSQYLCLEETVLWRFDGQLLSDPAFVRDYPHLIINLMHSLGGKTLAMHETLSYTGTGRTLVQLCRWLIRAAETHGSTTFRPGLTQQELADTLGVHRATLVRGVQSLREQGVLGAFTKASLVILDLQALRLLADE